MHLSEVICGMRVRYYRAWLHARRGIQKTRFLNEDLPRCRGKKIEVEILSLPGRRKTNVGESNVRLWSRSYWERGSVIFVYAKRELLLPKPVYRAWFILRTSLLHCLATDSKKPIPWKGRNLVKNQLGIVLHWSLHMTKQCHWW